MTDVDLSVDELAAKRLREAPLRKWLRERGVYAPADLGEITRLSADGSTLPAEIGQLVNLKTLYAADSTLPEGGIITDSKYIASVIARLRKASK